jgi:hypothetical protein
MTPASEEGIWNEELRCCVVEVRYGFPQKIGIAILKDGHCTDMCGAILFFQRIDPSVRQVQTYGGSKGDTIYTRVGNAKWHPGIIGKWMSGSEAA